MDQLGDGHLDEWREGLRLAKGMLYLEVVGDDQRRGSRDGEDLALAVIDARPQRRRREIDLDLVGRDRRVVVVIDHLDEEQSHPECHEPQRQQCTKEQHPPRSTHPLANGVVKDLTARVRRGVVGAHRIVLDVTGA